ncbi:hypothetical protein EB118_20060, partial [bacterium]|nr:hypothetical protein [bacterium]
GYTKTPEISILRRDTEISLSKINNPISFFPDAITPTITPTVTKTPAPTYTATKTSPQTPTPTTTPPPTNSLTVSLSRSYSPAPTVTPSDYSNLVISPESIIQSTQTPSPSITPTRTKTPTPSLTKTKTPTPTLTVTKTPTPTITKTKTPTPTLTKTYSPTPTVSASPSITPSPSMQYSNKISYDATLIPRMNYSINKITIIDSGRYRTSPTVSAIPSYTAEYKAIIDNADENFEYSPNIKVIGSTISSAFIDRKDPELLPVINYKIAEVTVLDGGYNYTIPPKIVLYGGYDPIKGIKAQLSSVLGPNNSVIGVSIDNPGNFYRSYPDIKVFTQDNGYGLKLKLKLLGSLEDIYITDVGRNLTPNSPNNRIIFESGGSGVKQPKAHIVLNNTAGSGFKGNIIMDYCVSHVIPLESGQNYNVSPNIKLENENFIENSINRSAVIQCRIEGLPKQARVINQTSPLLRQYNIQDMYMVGSKPKNTLWSDYYHYNFYSADYRYSSNNLMPYVAPLTGISGVLLSGVSGVPLKNGVSGVPVTGVLGFNYLKNQYNVGTFSINTSGYYMKEYVGYSLLPINQFVFYEKPHIIFDHSYALSSKTYLSFAGYSVSDTGNNLDPISSPNTINSGFYITTNKSQAYSSRLPDYNNGFSQFNSISSMNSIHGNIHNLDERFLGMARSIPKIDIYLGTEGKICGISNFILGLGHQVSVVSGISRIYGNQLILPGFFDILPHFSIEDELDGSSEITLSQNSTNNLVRLAHSAQSFDSRYHLYMDSAHDDWYTIDGVKASGIFKSDFSISSSNNYTSKAILICDSGGIPTSWNNPPAFDVNIVSGSINSVQISDGGKGFGLSLYSKLSRGAILGDHYVYFSGGGGSGAYGKLVSSFVPSGYVVQDNPYLNMGTITEVILLNSGVGYTSKPDFIIIDGSPTWNNIEYNNKLYNRKTNTTHYWSNS